MRFLNKLRLHYSRSRCYKDSNFFSISHCLDEKKTIFRYRFEDLLAKIYLFGLVRQSLAEGIPKKFQRTSNRVYYA